MIVSVVGEQGEWRCGNSCLVSVYLNWHYGNAGRCIKSKKVHRDWGPVH